MRHISTAAAIVAGLSLLAVPLTSCSAAPAPAGGGKTAGGLRFEDLARFDEPWAMAVVPDSPYLLVTERRGGIRLVDATGAGYPVSGGPKVDYGGQGGLGDVAFAPRDADPDPGDAAYPVYLSWVEAGPNGTRGAVVGRGTLVLDEMDGNHAITGLRVIWRQNPKVGGRGHFAHRLAFSPDGRHLFVASGDRQKMTPAQDLSGNLGKIVRLLPEGTPAPGNPYAARGGVTAQVWTLGHRNILGLRFDPGGRLWALEHGPRGGDELNLIKAGANFGWPVVSQGDHYDGRDIPRHATRPEFAAPAISWNPVIAPGDFVFYTGPLFPAWRGQAIIAGLVCECLVRVAIEGDRAREVARIPMGRRIRDVEQGPDGALYIIEDKEGARLRRITPG